MGKDGAAFQCGWRRFWRYYFVKHLAVIAQTTLLDNTTRPVDISLVNLGKFRVPEILLYSYLSCMLAYQYSLPKFSALLMLSYVIVYASSSCQYGMSASKLLVGNDLSWSAESSANTHAICAFSLLLWQFESS